MVEDIAIIVDEEIQARIFCLLSNAGGKLLVDVQLFDIYRNENQVGKKHGI